MARTANRNHASANTHYRLIARHQKIEKDLVKFARSLEGREGGGKKARKPRRGGRTNTLASVIKEVMVPGQEMSTSDVVEAIQKKNLYDTSGKYFYAHVNRVLNEEPQVKKVQRGVYSPKARRGKKANGGEKTNFETLGAGILKALESGEPKTTPEIIESLSEQGIRGAKSKSQAFYTKVYNKVNRMPEVEKVDRGAFALKKEPAEVA